jgi:hypothetical protein
VFVVTAMETSNKIFKFMSLPQREDNDMHPFKTRNAFILFNYEFSVDQLPTGYSNLVGDLDVNQWAYEHVY